MMHFIITRFNLRTEVFKTDRNSNMTLTKEWYKERFDIFDSICYPSIRNQINKNFIWYILFDSQTPDEYLDKINGYKCDIPKIIPIFCDGTKTLLDEVKLLINQEITSDTQNIITTRLDNDDAFREDFTQEIMNYAKTVKQKTLIDFPGGYQLYLNKKNSCLRKYNSNYNPFLTLIEPKENYITIWNNKHKSWKKSGLNVIKDKKNRIWIQTIHNRNIGNKLKKNDYITNKKNMHNFNLNLSDIEFRISKVFIIQDSIKVTGNKILKKTKEVYKTLKNLAIIST